MIALIEKLKPTFIVEMLSVDNNGDFLLNINGKIYKGNLGSKEVWDCYLSKIKNRGILIKKIKERCFLEKTSFVIQYYKFLTEEIENEVLKELRNFKYKIKLKGVIN